MQSTKLPFRQRIRPFLSLNSWMMVIVGLAIFSVRIEFAPGGYINLPVAFTILQTAALMFTLCGLLSMLSQAVWPDISVAAAIQAIREGKENPAAAQASGMILAGLLVFYAVALYATVTWLSSALGAGIR